MVFKAKVFLSKLSLLTCQPSGHLENALFFVGFISKRSTYLMKDGGGNWTHLREHIATRAQIQNNCECSLSFYNESDWLTHFSCAQRKVKNAKTQDQRSPSSLYDLNQQLNRYVASIFVGLTISYRFQRQD